MEFYYEQSVAGNSSRRNAALYLLCWMLIVLLMIAAMAFAANVLGNNPDTIEVNWLSAAGLVLCLGVAAVLFLSKDHLRKEYDYILKGDVLEIYAILNRRRRCRLAVIKLQNVRSCGRVSSAYCRNLIAQRDVHQHAWKLLSGGYYLYYMEENLRHLAMLQLDDQLASLLHRQLPVGVWQNIEEESGTNASLS